MEAIRARGWDALRLDTDRFPAELGLTLEQAPGAMPRFLLEDGTRTVDLNSVCSVWYRRFYSAQLDAELEPKYQNYCKGESRTLLASLFAALEGARWVDPIPKVHRAHHKVLQLEVAKRVGFVIPETLATNDEAAARRFFEANRGRVVTKMLNSITLGEDGQEQMVFTSAVREEHLEALSGLRHCPVIFQEQVPKDVELRVAVVGQQLFVASIDTRDSDVGRLDWRQDQQLAHKFQAARLPEEVEAKVLRLMQFYDLTYGSLDIIRRPDGEHVFLEINSAGEWGWLAQSVGLPIAEALAEQLTQATPQAN